ncbi:hypothetical protein H8E77_01085 [bacterium]|nr:hypothetical protein [bacterium]
MKGKLFMLAFVIAVTTFVINSIAAALTFDFVGKDAQKWFDDFVGRDTTTQGGGDAGWHLTADGLTTDDNVGTGHERLGFSADWTDYTVEAQYKYLTLGAHKEAHLYVRWVDEANNYYFRTIGRGAQGGAWSIEWLRKVDGGDNEGDIGDDLTGELQADTVYGLRGEIKGQVLTVDFLMDGTWSSAGEVEYPGPHETGGIGVGRASAQVAWQYIEVNGPGIPTTPVEALGKLATTWGRLKR